MESAERIPQNELDFGSDDEEIVSSDTPAGPKYMDQDEPSDDDETPISKNIPKSVEKIKPAFPSRVITDYIYPNANRYNYKNWHECFPDKKVCLKALLINPEWNEFMAIVSSRPYYKKMEKILSDYLCKNEETILPPAELVFSALNVLSPKNIRVVQIGQDPYPGATKINGKYIPEATGISFSVPLNYPRAKSLTNIYGNMIQFGHLKSFPKNGCLGDLVVQGFFMINAAFTTFYGKKNAHKNVWASFTSDLLDYINKKCNNVVFLVWGAEAHRLCQKLDPIRHCIITSSHPSPLGFDKTFVGKAYGPVKNEADRKTVTYSSFKTIDHFGRINEYLKSVGKPEIFYDIID